MEVATTRRGEVSDEELREAEEGLVRLLHKKRFPREWIERNVPDAMAQARSDFAARLAAGKEDDTVNLLVVIGYRRALKVLDRELAGPSTTSIETVFHLADESAPTPEEEAIEHDRQERVVKALASLPERERALMALVYFDGKSVREAGRRLGWGKSSADRHHRSALEKLHELLDRSLLSPEIPIPAYIAAHHWHNSPLRALERWVGGAGETVTESVIVGSGRFGQAAEGASAAASSGAGRTAAGICGAAVAVCLTGAATGVVGPGVGLGAGGEASPTAAHHRAAPREVAAPVQINAAPPPPSPSPAAAERSGAAKKSAPKRADSHETEPHKAADRARESRKRSSDSGAPAATTEETVQEFGVEGGEAQSTPESSAAPAPAPAPAVAPGAAPSGGSSSSSDSSGAGSSGKEFGM